MRPAPPLQVTIARFGVWRAAVGSVMAVTALSITTWLAALHDDAALARPAARVVVALSSLIGIGAAATLLKQRPVSLRWDGQRWHLGAAASVGHEPLTGGLRVAIDLGRWMLLRFDGDAGMRRRQVRWIPLQRSSVPQAWHALRCAVYSPRPEIGDPSLDSPGSASTRPSLPG